MRRYYYNMQSKREEEHATGAIQSSRAGPVAQPSTRMPSVGASVDPKKHHDTTVKTEDENETVAGEATESASLLFKGEEGPELLGGKDEPRPVILSKKRDIKNFESEYLACGIWPEMDLVR